ncbi:MAG: hypothetical protein HYY42_04455 [Chloroflexi bacterium]|nr:hypothetical protein [Chloroflexota bacterium]
MLDLMYGQMLTAAATGEWDRAIDLSAQLLRQMPAYRDVSARRAGYLEQLYTSASASLSEGDIPQAVKLFTALVAAEPGYRDAADKLRQARLASTKPLAGGYAVGEILRRGEWDVTLASVIVESDGRLTVAVKWSNASGSDRTATCSGDVGRGLRPLLTLADGVGIAPTETACSLRSGEVIPAGKAFTESATFPPLADATRPFRVSWYGVGISREIVLRP